MDHRDVAAATRPWWKKGSIDERAMRLTAVVWDENADEVEIDAPFRYATCGTCNGRGSHVNPNIDRQGITREEFDEDPQFFEDYRRGVFDVPCARCHGKRVVPVPDERGVWENPGDLQLVKDHIDWMACEAREIVHEQKMGY